MRDGMLTKRKRRCDVAEKAQQTIEGAADKSSVKLRRAGKVYAKAYYQWKELGEDAAVGRALVLELMREEGVEKFQIDGVYEVTLQHSDKVTLKTLTKEE